MHFNFKKRFTTLVLILLISVLPHSVFAAISHDISLEWQTLQSKHFEVHFHDGEQALAEKTVNIAERLLIELQENLQWQVKDTIEIIVSDEKDLANGFVSPLLTHLRMTIFPTAPNELFDFDNWLELLIKHELTHVVHLDKAKGKPEYLKKIFGRHPLLYPNLYQPLWLIEGYATFQETNKARGTGRGQSSIFNMMMRTEVKNGIKPVEQVNLNIANWPVGTTRYLYGYYFYEFLETNYDKATITRFIDSYSDNLIPYRLNFNAKLIFNKTFEQLWQDFVIYLSNKFQPDIDKINSQDIVSGERVTSSGYFKLFAQPLENGNLLYAEYDAINPPHLLLKKFKIDKTEFISEVQRETRLDFHPTSGVLISQIEIYRNTNAFYDLFQLDLKNKNLKRLTRGDRFRNAIWNPSGNNMLAIYNKLGRHSLVLLNEQGDLIDLLWEGEEGEYISGMDWSPDNQHIVASVKRNHNSWNLEEFNINQRSWKTLTQSPSIEIQPQYSPDGESIYFSADYDGVFNIQKFDLNSGNIDTLTHVPGGAFSPRLNSHKEMFYIAYTAQGYDIFRLDNPVSLNETPLQSQAITATAAQLTKLDKPHPPVDFEINDYSATTQLSPSWWTPTLWGNQNTVQLGAYTSGSDALKRHVYDARFSFDFESSSLSGVINYSFDQWFPLLQTRLETRGRKNYRTDTYQFEVLAPLFSRNKKLYLGTAIIYEKNSETITLNDASEVSTTSVDPSVNIGVIFDTRRRQPLSVSPSHGRLLSLTAETSDLIGGDINGKMVTAKWAEYISIKPQHVLALRFIGGFGFQSPRPFQLGGSLSDAAYLGDSLYSSLPLRTTLYNKRRYALRGYSVGTKSLIGRRMMMYNLEWRFPLERIERSLNMLPLGLRQISSTLFAETASVWNNGTSPGGNYHHSVGTELNFHTEWFFFMPLQARLGLAYGLREGGELQAYFAFNSSF